MTKLVFDMQKYKQEKALRNNAIPSDLVFPELQNIPDKEYKTMVMNCLKQPGVQESYIYTFMKTDVATLPGAENKLNSDY
jgi:hypothetical protein